MIQETCDRFLAALKLVDLLEAFNEAHNSVSKPPINTYNLPAFAKVERIAFEHEKLHHKFAPSSKGRSVISPKLRVFFAPSCPSGASLRTKISIQ